MEKVGWRDRDRKWDGDIQRASGTGKNGEDGSGAGLRRTVIRSPTLDKDKESWSPTAGLAS
jgi:hypothetical protein